jgi:hypothetical protein
MIVIDWHWSNEKFCYIRKLRFGNCSIRLRTLIFLDGVGLQFYLQFVEFTRLLKIISIDFIVIYKVSHDNPPPLSVNQVIVY